MTHGPSGYTRGCRCDVCRDGKAEYNRAHYAKNKERIREKAHAWYAENREARLAKGQKRQRVLSRFKTQKGCARCGFRGHPAALQFHHRDPQQKQWQIGGSAFRSRAALKAEIAKCDVLCANCHAAHHHAASPKGQ